MNIVQLEKELSALILSPGRSAKRRRTKVYVASLGENFYLVNPSGRPLSPAAKLWLAKNGIQMGWKPDEAIGPREVNIWELGNMVTVRRLQSML